MSKTTKFRKLKLSFCHRVVIFDKLKKNRTFVIILKEVKIKMLESSFRHRVVSFQNFVIIFQNQKVKNELFHQFDIFEIDTQS